MTGPSLAAAFARALANECSPRDPHALEPAVSTAWQRACDAHPTIAVDAEDFFAFAGARIRTGDPCAELKRRHIADLYLACACDQGQAAAFAELEQQILPVVARGLASFAERSELIQVLCERMLVEKAGRRGIAAYDGRAPLAVWLRVCATRIGIRQADRERRVAAVDDRQLEQLAPGVPDPELEYLKRLYGEQFRVAFAHAVTTLAPRERNLLRFSVIDGLGIDQIAAIFHVHRATVARQLQHARAALVEATRERMRVTLGVSASELESIMRMITNLADITLRQVLAKGRGNPR